MKSLKQIESEWSYEGAVERLKPMVVHWVKRTLEVARELYIANKMLSHHGVRTDLTSCQMVQGSEDDNGLTLCTYAQSSPGQFRTFKDFCSAIGISYRTAQKWISLYDSDRDYLLTMEEYIDERVKELDAFYESVRKKREKIAGYIPEAKDINLKWNRNIVAWTEAVERKFDEWLIAKGYKDIDPNKVLSLPSPASEDYDEFGLFGFEYLDSLAKKCTKKVSGEGAKEYLNMTKEYGPRIPRGVDTRNILRIPVIVEAEFDDLDTFQKRETAKVLSEIIMKLALEEKK